MTDLTVVKLGGSLLENEAMLKRTLEAIAARFTAGERLVVVHGGGKRIDATLVTLGIPKRVHEGLRITDGRTLDVVVSVLAGLVNKSLVGALRARGVKCAGISGADGDTLWAEFFTRADGVELGFVGRVAWSDPTLLRSLLEKGMLPIVASVAIGREGTLLNVNADAAAAAIATALSASRLVFLTDVEGILDAEGKLLHEVDPPKARALLRTGAVNGGMKPKLAACLEAVASGVGEVLIAGPSRHDSVLLSGEGGTRLAAA